MLQRLRNHLRIKRMRSQLKDIGFALQFYRGDSRALPFGWALLPMRRAGFGGCDHAVDDKGAGPLVLVRDILVMQPCEALVYYLDDADRLEDCTPMSTFFNWADDLDLLRVKDWELRRLSAIACDAYCDAVCNQQTTYSGKILRNLERYAEFDGWD